METRLGNEKRADALFHLWQSNVRTIHMMMMLEEIQNKVLAKKGGKTK
jgi:hypothetical protein